MRQSQKVGGNILERIGDTPLLALRQVTPKSGARILIKIESENPTGSMKDRMALAMIEAAEADGRLKPGGSVVEYTGGSTGVSLSLVCSVKGHPLHIVTSDAFAREKLQHMEALGATLKIVPSEGGGMTAKLTRTMIEEARVISQTHGSFWTDQFNNRDQVKAYHAMAEDQTSRERFCVNLGAPEESRIAPKAALDLGDAQVAAELAPTPRTAEVSPWLALVAMAALTLELWAFHRRW